MDEVSPDACQLCLSPCGQSRGDGHQSGAGQSHAIEDGWPCGPPTTPKPQTFEAGPVASAPFRGGAGRSARKPWTKELLRMMEGRARGRSGEAAPDPPLRRTRLSTKCGSTRSWSVVAGARRHGNVLAHPQLRCQVGAARDVAAPAPQPGGPPPADRTPSARVGSVLDECFPQCRDEKWDFGTRKNCETFCVRFINRSSEF